MPSSRLMGQVGLTPHVPSLQSASLPEQRHDNLFLSVVPVDGVPLHALQQQTFQDGQLT